MAEPGTYKRESGSFRTSTPQSRGEVRSTCMDHSQLFRNTALFDTWEQKLLECAVSSEGYPSGQREQTVNLPALPSKVRILPPPPFGDHTKMNQRWPCFRVG